jgi:quercetin dioxygenase-like cupin family protein
MQKLQIIPWPEGEPATETAIRRKLAEEGLGYYTWANGPGDFYSEHTHPYHKIIYVVRGSITFQLPDRSEEFTLGAGSRLELPAHAPHSALVGPEGVTCYEAHL